MIEVILFEPEIPQNTGNVGRLCSFANCRLHLIHPLGFEINDKNLRRAGMDYWKSLELVEHKSWEDFLCSPKRPKRLHLFSTHAKLSMWETSFKDGDGLLFGNEGHGVPPHVHEWFGIRKVSIPRMKNGLRSLNLAVSVGIATYEALRQISLTRF